ncbi:MAG: T9SS type A sorting domain-containing protein [Bacteroidia bacterium]|nr:T9SS type A sorting domain-containing protein [Bacteroidia bacterium]
MKAKHILSVAFILIFSSYSFSGSQTFTGTNGTTGAGVCNSVSIPGGATSLSFSLTMTGNDYDLYVRTNATCPTSTSYSNRSENSGTSSELISYAGPIGTFCGSSSTYTVLVYKYGSSNGTWTLTVSWTDPSSAAPACATTPSPSNGASTICSGSVSSISWASVTNATSYDVYFGSGSLPGTVTANVAGTSYSTGALSTGTYYWRIIPKNCNGSASGCTTWSFTVIDCINMTNGSINTCNAIIYDNGGSGSNYSNSQNLTYTICPSSAGQYVRLAFTSWGVESNFDYLSIFDGNSTSENMIVGSSFSSSSPGTVTATTANTTGCLTLRFFSDGATTGSGFQATVSCVATGAAPPSSYSAQDCGGAFTICSNENFNYQSSGPGDFNDANSGLGNRGCLNNYAATPNGSAEHQSVWGYFSPSSSGTIGMTLDPSGSSSTDYDWAIWGPFTTLSCPPMQAPLRCSAAAAANSTGAMTGMGNGAADTEEGSGGNGWVSTINVTAGQKYIIMVDNWNATSAPLTLSWQLSGGASLACTPLPIELISFKGKADKSVNILQWTTATEINNDFFTLEKSIDGVNFVPLTTIDGAGNSTDQLNYQLTDNSPFRGVTYYRLKQTDFDGTVGISIIETVTNEFVETTLDNLRPNPTSDGVNFDFYTTTSGTLKIEVYDYTGKLVINENRFVEEGKSTLSGNLGSLSKGLYTLKVLFEKNGFSSTQKIIKQ